MRTLLSWRRMWGACLVVFSALSIVAAVVCWIAGPERYEAVTRLQVGLPDEGVSEAEVKPPDRTAQNDYVELQQELLRSRFLLQAVVRKERLTEFEPRREAQDIVERLQHCIDVRVAGPESWRCLLDVRVTFENAQKAASVANTLADEFIDWNAARQNERWSSALFFLRNQLSGLEGEVTKAEEDLHHYRMRTKYVTFDEERNPIAQALSRAQDGYAAAQSRANEALVLVNMLEAHIAAGKPLETFQRIGADPQMQRRRADLAQLELELAQRLKSPIPDDPEVKPLEAKVDLQRALVGRLAEQAAGLLRGEAEVTGHLEQAMAARVVEWESRLMDWNRARVEYDVLRRKTVAKIALFEQMLAQVNELDIRQKQRPNNTLVVDRATPPESPVHPWRKPALLLFAAGVLAGLVGLALARVRGTGGPAAAPG